MKNHVFESVTAIMTPFCTLASSALSCWPWSSSKLHRRYSCSGPLSPVIDFSEFGRMYARIIARPTVATPSIKKSYILVLGKAVVEALRIKEPLTHRQPSRPCFPSSFKIATANRPPKAFPI